MSNFSHQAQRTADDVRVTTERTKDLRADSLHTRKIHRATRTGADGPRGDPCKR